MPLTNVPTSEVKTSQHSVSYEQHQRAVYRPTAQLFAYRLATCMAATCFVVTFGIIAFRASMRTALPWYGLAAMAAILISGGLAVKDYQRFHEDHRQDAVRVHERTHTEYKAHKTEHEPAQRPMTRDDSGTLKLGRYGYSHTQRRKLARGIPGKFGPLQTGDNVSHKVLHAIGMVSGDIKRHGQKLNDIQDDLCDIGYCVKNGALTQLTEKGYREWLDHPPTPPDETGG